MRRLALLPAERGPRVLFGKTYHWTVHRGFHRLERCAGAVCAGCKFQ